MFEAFVEAVGDRFPNIVIQDETTVQTEQAVYTIVARLGEGGQGSVFGARVEKLLTKFLNFTVPESRIVCLPCNSSPVIRRSSRYPRAGP